MELGQDFSLAYTFHWDQPISTSTQESIAAYGSDEDRIRLVGHSSVTVATLGLLAMVPSPVVRLAVADNPATPPEALALIANDHSRAVRAAGNAAIENLPEAERDAARALVESPMQRLKSRLTA
jgi:carboxylesterase type B